MKSTFGTAVAIAATAAAVIGGLATAGPASADPGVDAFTNALGNADLMLPGGSDPVALGQSVCPMLAQPGQTVADAAAKVADSSGMSLGPATMFTGFAISSFCPGVVGALSNGKSPLPLGLFGLG
ncbi:DUF732 domain-containing protein [Mycobacterium sp. CBMA293]|uniref:DUF732 domain-containing protein n=2 Tax=Mycolicibacterium TaxID=1866885 RepID=UPI0012DC4486|nr:MULTISPECIES: DUF732 domain-containing protein [unclassified Mycolicibacterium]MUL48716.1 DUF732 domain-containing protein [Mycolicibacterium sp. CBMA 360]MUL62170.1 DUF732 domain-containing protein [Mycolicibacterium sp. CBMA 335]MUL71631.1 DUF732 domain-containing protein [Mycolicibacterium sp. CBMA 311]MUL93586.1 DUF732 domain-containing protein [Mycolicibacterium sp. CBMA 230]MUM10472.1 DUF732 domain-containing protein [Mycolicibacterium sp. CBMA 293]